MKKFYSTVVNGFLKDEFLEDEFAGIRLSMETLLFKEFLDGNIVIGIKPFLMFRGYDYDPEPIAVDGRLYSKTDMIRYCRQQYNSDSKDAELLINQHIYDFNSLLGIFRISDLCLKDDKAILYFISRRFPAAKITDLNWTSELVNGFISDSKFYALELAEGGLFKEWCLSKKNLYKLQ